MADIAKDNRKDHPGQLLTFVKDSYLDRTSRPIYAIIYLLGFIILYEIGTFLFSSEVLSKSLGTSQRVISFIWVQDFLGCLGFSAPMAWVATPFVVIIILLALQITSRSSWRVYPKDFIPMTIECVLLAIPLIVLGMALNNSVTKQEDIAFGQATSGAYCSATSAVAVEQEGSASDTTGMQEMSQPGVMAKIITAIGAGIYEELVFRLILICLLMLFFQDILHLTRNNSIVLSVLISAFLFSAHHHIHFINGRFGFGEPFAIIPFTFRVLAGVYFAGIFAMRGFAIVAGAHAFYDIIAVGLNAMLFTGLEQG